MRRPGRATHRESYQPQAGIANSAGRKGGLVWIALLCPRRNLRLVRSRCISGCRHRTLLLLLTPSVPGHAPRLVVREYSEYEQHHQGGNGGDDQLELLTLEIGTEHGCLCRSSCQEFNWLRVYQQDDGGKDGDHEFHQNPIVPEQAPLGTQ